MHGIKVSGAKDGSEHKPLRSSDVSEYGSLFSLPSAVGWRWNCHETTPFLSVSSYVYCFSNAELHQFNVFLYILLSISLVALPLSSSFNITVHCPRWQPSFIHSWHMTEPRKSSSDFINHSFLLLQSLSYVNILYPVSPCYMEYLPESSHLRCKNFPFVFFTETPALRFIQ